ncbi:hypothetical protein TRICI_003602 [Trichomonascus ciferrii]|uniref:Uncharacterized protein n=1 Tax=Trichomonascus ciferrii TaxID=44093 RepID=A0A642V3E3_9ASCO|nr:hypothetical protein TRICI_003602 [Trichomonascus ciferrii]
MQCLYCFSERTNRHNDRANGENKDLFVEAWQSQGGAGGWPPANPNPEIVSWGLSSLETMGNVQVSLLVEASQRYPAPANLTHNLFSGGIPQVARARFARVLSSFYSWEPSRATGVQGAGPLQEPILL